MWSTLDVQLAIALAGLLGFVLGVWFCGAAVTKRDLKHNRNIEKSGIWRCEDRGYYLVKQSRLGGEPPMEKK